MSRVKSLSEEAAPDASADHFMSLDGLGAVFHFETTGPTLAAAPAPNAAAAPAPNAAAATASFELLAFAVDLPGTIDIDPSISLAVAAVQGSVSSGGTTATSSLVSVMTSYTSGSASVIDSKEYNVNIVFKGTWTADLQAAFVQAANAISSFIIGDVPDTTLIGAGGRMKIDDISITAEVTTIDGVGGILGQAGPTALRSTTYLPATAKMSFDIADANALFTTGWWDEVVQHEMMHSIGFGSIWDRKGLVQQVSTTEAWYTGANGNAAYRATVAGLGPTDRIAVETDGGAGTALSHWDEATYGHELMTGYLNTDAPDPLTTMSIASLKDLGYVVASQYLFA